MALEASPHHQVDCAQLWRFVAQPRDEWPSSCQSQPLPHLTRHSIANLFPHKAALIGWERCKASCAQSLVEIVRAAAILLLLLLLLKTNSAGKPYSICYLCVCNLYLFCICLLCVCCFMLFVWFFCDWSSNGDAGDHKISDGTSGKANLWIKLSLLVLSYCSSLSNKIVKLQSLKLWVWNAKNWILPLISLLHLSDWNLPLFYTRYIVYTRYIFYTRNISIWDISFIRDIYLYEIYLWYKIE